MLLSKYVKKIALGTAQFGVDYGAGSVNGQVDSKEVSSILNYARLQNINLLDTAPSYGNSETVLGKFNLEMFNVITKTRHFNKKEINNNDVELLKKDFNHSLMALKKESIYGVLIHDANDLLKPGSKKLMSQLQTLKHEGKIMKLGVSIYDHNQLYYILENFDIDLVQLPFNIIDKRLIESGIFAKLKKKGIEVHARSDFLQGLLLVNAKERSNKFKRWAELWKIWHEWLNDNQLTALEASIRYAVSFSEISKVLVGVHSKDQLKQIISASDGILPNIPNELHTNDCNLLNPSNWNRL